MLKNAAPETGRTLIGMDEITEYAGRGEKVIGRWIANDGFPAVKVDNRWESNTLLIDKWRRRRIERLCPDIAAGW